MAEMMNLDAFRREIADFVERLPTDHFHSNVVAFSWGDRADRARLEAVAVITESYDAEPLRLVHLFANRALLHAVLFALFSGRTLAISGPDARAARSLARRLSALSPFDAPLSVGAAGAAALRHSIVVTVAHIPHTVTLSVGGNQPLFDGPQCPPDSIVAREFSRGAEESENRFILSLSNDAKRLFGRFRFKIAELCGRGADTEEAVVRGLRAERFGAGDLPLFKFWMANLARPAAKPVIIDAL
jgi:hypothetical protein